MHQPESRPDCSLSLLEILQREVESGTQLLQVLHREHAALTANTPDILEHAARDKLHCLKQVEAIAAERTELLRAAGVIARAQDAAAYLSAAPDTRLAMRWQQGQRILVECRRQNQINGSVIELSRRHTLRALSLLRGQAHDQPVYSASGETCALPPSQSLATA